MAMELSLNTNQTASHMSRMLGLNNTTLQNVMTRLSTGKRINNSSDDAGGLAVSMKLSAALARTAATQNNVGNAISFLQAQDGALECFGSTLTRISELKTMYSDITKSTSDKANYDAELTQLTAQLESIAAETFNSINLFSDDDLGDVQTNEDGTQAVTITASNLTAVNDVFKDKTSLKDITLANITTAIQNVATMRATNGALVNRLNIASELLSINQSNLEAANGRILDTDVAEDSTKLAQYNIKMQSTTAMLAQANTLPQMAARLILG